MFRKEKYKRKNATQALTGDKTAPLEQKKSLTCPYIPGRTFRKKTAPASEITSEYRAVIVSGKSQQKILLATALQ